MTAGGSIGTAHGIDTVLRSAWERGIVLGTGARKPGYACDNDAGIHFEGTDVKRVVATCADAKVYFVSVVDGVLVERTLEPELID